MSLLSGIKIFVERNINIKLVLRVKCYINEMKRLKINFQVAKRGFRFDFFSFSDFCAKMCFLQ